MCCRIQEDERVHHGIKGCFTEHTNRLQAMCDKEDIARIRENIVNPREGLKEEHLQGPHHDNKSRSGHLTDTKLRPTCTPTVEGGVTTLKEEIYRTATPFAAKCKRATPFCMGSLPEKRTSSKHFKSLAELKEVCTTAGGIYVEHPRDSGEGTTADAIRQGAWPADFTCDCVSQWYHSAGPVNALGSSTATFVLNTYGANIEEGAASNAGVLQAAARWAREQLAARRA